jgi:hypothetical protein
MLSRRENIKLQAKKKQKVSKDAQGSCIFTIYNVAFTDVLIDIEKY